MQDTVKQADRNIKDWYQGLDANTRSAITRGLVGGGVAGAGMLALRGTKPDYAGETFAQHAVSPALMAAVLGGGAAAGLPLGLKALTGRLNFKHEDKPGLAGRVIDTVALPFTAAPGMTLGGLGGGLLAFKGKGDFREKARGDVGKAYRASDMKGPSRFREATEGFDIGGIASELHAANPSAFAVDNAVELHDLLAAHKRHVVDAHDVAGYRQYLENALSHPLTMNPAKAGIRDLLYEQLRTALEAEKGLGTKPVSLLAMLKNRDVKGIAGRAGEAAGTASHNAKALPSLWKNLGAHGRAGLVAVPVGAALGGIAEKVLRGND